MQNILKQVKAAYAHKRMQKTHKFANVVAMHCPLYTNMHKHTLYTMHNCVYAIITYKQQCNAFSTYAQIATLNDSGWAYSLHFANVQTAQQHLLNNPYIIKNAHSTAIVQLA